MKTELHYLLLVTILTGALFLPYVLNRLVVRGIIDTVGFPENPKPQSAWSQRLQKAHTNAIENLVIFASLVLIANAAGISNPAIATASIVYFWARVLHVVTYTFGIAWVRTVGFLIGVGAQATIAWQLLQA